jgi:hypothetical protein
MEHISDHGLLVSMIVRNGLIGVDRTEPHLFGLGGTTGPGKNLGQPPLGLGRQMSIVQGELTDTNVYSPGGERSDGAVSVS